MTDSAAAREPFEPIPFLDVPFGPVTPEQISGLDGLAQLEGILRGDLPAPTMARTMRQWIASVEKGYAEFRGEPSEDYLNPMGLVHGGWVMALLDTVLGCAVHTTLDATQTYVSTGTEVKFIKPILLSTGQVRAVGRAESRGAQMATASAHVHDTKGRLLATGTTSCFIRKI